MNETTPPIMTINDEMLAELEAAADAASPGEWVSTGPSFGQSSPAYLDAVATFNDGEESTVCTMPDWSEEYWPERTANAAFIATANPATILALLQHVRELKADAERIEWLESVWGGHTGRDGGFHLSVYMPRDAETLREMVDTARSSAD